MDVHDLTLALMRVPHDAKMTIEIDTSFSGPTAL